jgi:hypothetical protein
VSLSTLLFIAGTVCGLYYGYLGIVAGGHLLDPEKRKSPGERLLLTGVAWSMGSGDKFSDGGKLICRQGNWILVAGILAWFAWGVTK